MAAINGEGTIIGTLQILHSLDTLWVDNFDEIALSRTVKEIEANLSIFCHFGKYFEYSKSAAIKLDKHKQNVSHLLHLFYTYYMFSQRDPVSANISKMVNKSIYIKGVKEIQARIENFASM